MSLLEQSRPSTKTLAWVGGAHVLLLLFFFLVPSLFKPEPPPQLITLIPLGTPDPADGNPDSPDTDSGGSSAKGGIQAVTPPSAQRPAPAPAPAPAKIEPAIEAPTPPPVKAVEPVKTVKETPIEPVKTVTPKVEAVKPTPEPAKTAAKETPKAPDKPKPKVKVDLTKVVSKTSTSNGTGSSTQSTTSKAAGSSESGLNASDVEKKLMGKFGNGKGEASGDGNGNAGIPKGKGQGAIGDPSGTGKAPWYDTYIGIQLKKNWAHPPSQGKLVTSVQVRILGDGTVQYLRITKSSGDEAMDQSVINAVQSVQKLDNPPPAMLPRPYDRVVQFEL